MMDSLPRRRINLTRTLPNPNRYTTALEGEFSRYAFSEERAPDNKGQWRSKVFETGDDRPMDLEIGTGNGFHFGHRAITFPNRCIVGIEIKYKPLFQAIRRPLKAGAKNAAMCRFHAFNIDDLFADGELNDVYIHFPDPWTSPKKPKNRIVNRAMLATLHRMQRPGSMIEFKTDSREAFLWCLEEIAASPYKVEARTLDLHRSEWAAGNFMTFFESLFVKDGIEINYIRLRR
ncbi:MAG: tRNA (guanine-N7)-methyltransferase [Bdellovibrionaceae bacterium]|nr:tRNA (guanine-N7)-methyltransferase [Pseudobdellovibrionaceae bacterium]MBX3032669.1 tRNA (guanine-N7)-methyltransferase [Pseudobdellovibrionaceae bacterium]